jgi:hypothetical protein
MELGIAIFIGLWFSIAGIAASIAVIKDFDNSGEK